MRISALIFILTALLGLATHAESQGAASGYLSNVEAERNERYYEVYLFVPQSSKETSLRDMIFNPLTKEFKIKYREAFGDMDLTSITSRANEMGGTSANPLILQQ